MLVWFQKLTNGAFLLLRREMRQQILFDLAGLIRCTVATMQLHSRDDAIARSRPCNQLNSISLATRLMK